MSKQRKSGLKNSQQITRRDFLKAGGAVVISTVLFNSLTACSAKTRTVTATETATTTATKTATDVITTTLAPPPTTRSFTDMLNRTVTVPVNITRIVPLQPDPSFMVWELTSPNKLVCTDRVFNSNLKKGLMLVPDAELQKLLALPIGPVNFDAIDPEVILALKPDVVIDMTKDANLEQLQTRLQIPIVAISKDNLNAIGESFRMVGNLVGNSQGGNKLGDYWDGLITRVTNAVAAIPPAERQVKVYYANSSLLSTVGTGTIMSSVMTMAGGIDYATANQNSVTQTTSESIALSLEQVLLWNPDVIITKTASERDSLVSNADWANVNALKKGRVFCCPEYERMDDMSAAISLVWTAKTLYPDKINFDLPQECKAFYSLFFKNDSMTTAQTLVEIS